MKRKAAGQDPRDAKLERLAHLDKVLKAIAHPVRRHILLSLQFRGGQMSAGDIAGRYSCRWPTVTRHLGVLRQAGLVTVKRSGRNLNYHLNSKTLKLVWEEWFKFFEL
jgi:DNA-binding transcriptional ArsR family regulator